jgi:hypothetical protein
VSRGLVIAIGVVIAFSIFMVWGVPALKNKFIGGSKQVKVEIVSAEDDYDIDLNGRSVSRTVVSMIIEFPMGRAPDNASELKVKDVTGKPVEVAWSQPDKADNDDQQITRWTFREVFLPIGFREGMLANQYTDLYPIRLLDVTTKSVQ